MELFRSYKMITEPSPDHSNEKGSAHYSERLDATILAKGKLTIEVGDKW